ncbi:MAG: hypothetical protein A2744_04585 [Candidatus Buchananbacteria bacterium RIFCSPHIGHO2_01_FULL_44_11]|uniref:DUF3352 domain-containing protein n=1 Tax=Candidatus Buchananbacteria bacterium RIFCSPHIGHO2_01_FULL_44_11 TaxID=1797535 RepID=A0A1G1Y399_9BACT|nr:MAG: hypothetical protein A2744_04585 [Candidatus Buchananbacteria bacterium RIFCSPHIGHO2_01_FULL_44_11]
MEDPFQHQNSQANLSRSQHSTLRAKKFWWLLAGIFVIILSAALIYRSTADQSEILSLVPIDSVFYLQANGPAWPWSKVEIADLPFANFYGQLETIFSWPAGSFQKNILAFSSQVTLAAVPNQNSGQLDFVLIIKSKNDSVVSVLNQSPHHLLLKKNLTAVTTSEEAIKKLLEVQQGQTFSLAGNVNSKKFGRQLLIGYFNLSNVKSYLAPENLAEEIFTQFLTGELYLNFNQSAGGWQFSLVREKTFISSSAKSKTSIKYLPADFFEFSSGLNLSELFSIWSQVDPELNKTFSQTAAAVTALYNFNLADEFSDLLSQPVDLILLPAQTPNVFGLDFILSLPSDNKTLNQLERLINIILAQKKPTAVDRLLPDGSQVTELIAEPDSFVWQTKDLAGQVVRYLSEPSLNFAAAYVVSNNRVVLATSIERLEQFLSTSEIVVSDLVDRCGFDLAGNLIFLNPQNFTWPVRDYLPPGVILIKPLESSGLSGCVIEN